MGGQKHFVLNGVPYFAAESAEGSHYTKGYQPLRPPNSTVVQGDTQATFQLRPDILQWSITDWSGGMGAYKYDPTNPGKHWVVSGRVFDEPGTWLPGAGFPIASDDETLDKGVLLIASLSTLYAFDTQAATMYTWSGTAWNAGEALTGAGSALAVDADATNVYLCVSGKVVSAAFGGTTFSTVASVDSPHSALRVAGDYLYLAPDTSSYAVREIPKAGGSAVDIAYHTIESYHAEIVPMDGKIYSMASASNRGTEILEIVPTSAAGTGFGYQLALLEGFQATAMWQHAGTLFMGGHDADDQGKLSIMYLLPDGTYGTLGPVMDATGFWGVPFAKGKMNRLLSHYFIVADSAATAKGESVTGAGQAKALLVYEIDSVTGNMAIVGQAPYQVLDIPGTIDAIMFKGDLWISFQEDTTGNPYHTMPMDFGVSHRDGYPAFFETGWHDFGISGEKVLSSFELIADDPMLNNWDISLLVYADGDASSTVYTSQWGENATLVKKSVTSSPVKFQTLKVRLEMRNDTSPQTAWPRVQALNVFVQVSRKQRVWDLLLDLSSDRGARDGKLGKRRIENLETLAESEGIFSFTDYYKSHNPETETAVSVLMDQCVIDLSQPGEGVAAVRLVEVA